MPNVSLMDAPIMSSFNPRPPLPGSDALARSDAFEYSPVSIHAPRCRGAMPAMGHGAWEQGMFQSTPPVAGERCKWSVCCCVVYAPVSIHAPRCRGAMQFASVRKVSKQQVSIHAPRCRGAMPGTLPGLVLWRQCCFNPRPPLPGSDAGHKKTRQRGFVVSIHAPRCRGAMPLRTVPMPEPAGKFQSTPPVAGERCQRKHQPW